jgi:hypothetical protein
MVRARKDPSASGNTKRKENSGTKNNQEKRGKNLPTRDSKKEIRSGWKGQTSDLVIQ